MHTPISNRSTNKLNEKRIRAFTGLGADAIGKKLADGGGMFLTVTPAGSAVWRLKYRLGGSERTYTIGAYPDTGLAAARDERERAKALLQKGRDPVQVRRIERT